MSKVPVLVDGLRFSGLFMLLLGFSGLVLGSHPPRDTLVVEYSFLLCLVGVAIAVFLVVVERLTVEEDESRR